VPGSSKSSSQHQQQFLAGAGNLALTGG
jgi:hypothetical protein